jgi:ABC-type phosphate transport system substrate-binding protein
MSSILHMAAKWWAIRHIQRYISLSLIGLSLCYPIYAQDNEVLAIVMARTQTSKINSSADLALIFLRKKLYWSNGQPIQAVNLPTEHSLRRQFSVSVLGSLPETQTDYWNGMYYQGVSPPYVVASSEAVLRFVAETAGAIGYVEACKVDNRVKARAWILANGDLTTQMPNLDCPH